MNDWTPTSWMEKPRSQYVEYPDQEAYASAIDNLRNLPPLVTSWEVEKLKQQLALASEGKCFLLQGGDCAERFEDCRSDVIAGKLKVLLMMSYILSYGSGRRMIRVGRFAGQYAKPRSTPTETRDGVTLPCYRGQLINQPEFTIESRTPNPMLMIRGYERAALTLNFVRGLVDGGFADLHHPEFWDVDFVRNAEMSDEFRSILDSIGYSVRFMETVAGRRLEEISRVDFFSSHEGLHLDYEAAQTRRVPRRTKWYNLNTHMPWIGDRTRQIDGAHVEYFRGIANPIGMKVGPSISPEELLALIDQLNPDNEPGRLTLIHRFGADRVKKCLPPLLQAVQRAGHRVLWCCDPLHGNTRVTCEGIKTRPFDDCISELRSSFMIHAEAGTILGGLHVELTAENVTECTGGARGLTEDDLKLDYRSDVDPRLNYEQAMEMSLRVARLMQRQTNHLD